jgi:hypothetical protein
VQTPCDCANIRNSLHDACGIPPSSFWNRARTIEPQPINLYIKVIHRAKNKHTQANSFHVRLWRAGNRHAVWHSDVPYIRSNPHRSHSNGRLFHALPDHWSFCIDRTKIDEGSAKSDSTVSKVIARNSMVTGFPELPGSRNLCWTRSFAVTTERKDASLLGVRKIVHLCSCSLAV